MIFVLFGLRLPCASRHLPVRSSLAETFAIACLETSGDSPLTQCKLFQIIEQRGPAQNPRRCVDGRLTDNLRLREVCRHRGPVCALESIFLLAPVQLLLVQGWPPVFLRNLASAPRRTSLASRSTLKSPLTPFDSSTSVRFRPHLLYFPIYPQSAPG